MNTTAIKNLAQRARRDFRKLVTDKAHALGIGKKDIAKAIEKGDALIIHGQAFPIAIKRQRDELIAVVHQQGFDHVVDSVAYTLFNRLCALRFMEVHDYLPQRVLSAKDGGDVPDILKNAADVAEKLFSDPKDRKEIKELKLAGTKDQELYRRLILAQCNTLAPAMPFLFEKQQDYSELLMPDNLLHSDSVIRDMVKSIDEADWHEIEIIGWLYQFYISERKDEVIGSVVEKEDIPAATQLFTPKWIVRYMVENSLGRLWLESHPDSPLKAKMPYFIENPDDGKTPPTKRFDTPDEIKCMDDACGSGHILVYKFDLLYEMYVECGYPKTEIPALILKNNLYGLDIDERAVQLASFALTMKAREKDSRFLEKGVLPCVIAIQESNDINLDSILNMGIRETSNRSPLEDPSRMIADQGLLPAQNRHIKQNEKALHLFKAKFQPLIELFQDAKVLGSLIEISDEIANRLSELKSLLRGLAGTVQLFDLKTLKILADLVRQTELLATKYDVCSTNPPYMGSGYFCQTLRSRLQHRYKLTRTDLFALFIERNLSLVNEEGFVSMITMQSWMFTSSYRQLREKLLSECNIVNMAQLGSRAFESIGGEIVSTTMFVIQQRKSKCTPSVFVRLTEGSATDKESAFRDAARRFQFSQKDFCRVPGCPIVYWKGLQLVDIFEKLPAIGSIALFREGIHTGDNERFLRRWWEVSLQRLGLRESNIEDVDAHEVRWIPYNKGGGCVRWYGNYEYVVAFDATSRSAMDELQGHVRPSQSLYFKEGGTWSDIGSNGFGVKYYPSGFLFDAKGPVCVGEDIVPIIAGLNSAPFAYLAEILMPTISYKCGTVKTIPFPEDFDRDKCRNLGLNAIRIAKTVWDDSEVSWDFSNMPLLRKGIEGETLEISHKKYTSYCADNVKQLQMLEVANNTHFINAYGLQDDLSPEVPEDQITLVRADVENDIKAFICYAIGCMMGRYSLSKLGLQFAGGEWIEAKFRGSQFMPDHDGILPLLNDAYFEDDPTERLAEFLIVTFGKETLNENLQFIAQTLGMKGNESPRETISRYLAETFFKDHLRTYKKRPIYWLFTSGKERAFQALVYMHRYTPATLSRMRTAYLHELQNKLNARVDEVQRGIEDATSTAQSNRLNKELIRLRRQQAELLAFDEKLNNLAGKKIAIDLDDGVKHNYGLFGDLLAEVKTVCGKDEE